MVEKVNKNRQNFEKHWAEVILFLSWVDSANISLNFFSAFENITVLSCELSIYISIYLSIYLSSFWYITVVSCQLRFSWSTTAMTSHRLYKPLKRAPFWRSVATNPKFGRSPVLIVCCFLSRLSANYGGHLLARWQRFFFHNDIKKKKAGRITPPRSVSRAGTPLVCRGQLGCREEFVSAAAVLACRDTLSDWTE